MVNRFHAGIIDNSDPGGEFVFWASAPRTPFPVSFNLTQLAELLRDDAVRADGERDDHVVINDEQQPVSVRHPKVKNLMTMPEQTLQLVGAKRGVPPVLAKQGKLGAGKAFDFKRQQGEFTLKPNAAPVGHKSLTVASNEG